jgi:hypothetical protein
MNVQKLFGCFLTKEQTPIFEVVIFVIGLAVTEFVIFRRLQRADTAS